MGLAISNDGIIYLITYCSLFSIIFGIVGFILFKGFYKIIFLITVLFGGLLLPYGIGLFYNNNNKLNKELKIEITYKLGENKANSAENPKNP